MSKTNKKDRSYQRRNCLRYNVDEWAAQIVNLKRNSLQVNVQVCDSYNVLRVDNTSRPLGQPMYKLALLQNAMLSIGTQAKNIPLLGKVLA